MVKKVSHKETISDLCELEIEAISYGSFIQFNLNDSEKGLSIVLDDNDALDLCETVLNFINGKK